METQQILAYADQQGRVYADWDETKHPRDPGGEGGGRFVRGGASRIARAKASHKPSTRKNQQIAYRHEASIAQLIDGTNLADNEPFDVIKGHHAVEVKVIIGGKNPKITMHPESLARKVAELRKNKRIGHTVVIDARGTPPAYYYKAGLGSFRLSAMQRVTRVHLREKFS